MSSPESIWLKEKNVFEVAGGISEEAAMAPHTVSWLRPASVWSVTGASAALSACVSPESLSLSVHFVDPGFPPPSSELLGKSI